MGLELEISVITHFSYTLQDSCCDVICIYVCVTEVCQGNPTRVCCGHSGWVIEFFLSISMYVFKYISMYLRTYVCLYVPMNRCSVWVTIVCEFDSTWPLLFC